MTIDMHWVFTGCDEDDKTQVIQYFQDRKLELEGKLAALPEEPAELRLAVYHDSDQAQWEIQAALHVAGQTQVAETRSPKLEQVWDDVFHGLAHQLDVLEERPGRVSRRRRGLQAVERLLERNRQTRNSEAFMAFLQPVVGSLHRYVRRELRVRERDEETRAEMLRPEEVLDEVLVRAWERFPQRPRDRAFDLWLIELAHEIIAEASRPVAEQSIEERLDLPDRDSRESEADSWTQQFAYPESIEFSELLPERASRELWDRLDWEAKETGLAVLLSRLPRDRRQALMLTAVEGFSSAEVADFQGRSVEEVEADMGEARVELQRQLEEELLPDLQEELENVAMREQRRRRR